MATTQYLLEERKYSTDVILLRYGLVSAGIFAGIFAIAALLGVADEQYLRFINILVFIIVGYKMIHQLYMVEDRINYISGMGLMVGLAAVAFGVFGSILFLYLKFFDYGLMEAIKMDAPFGAYLTTYHAASWVISEGIGASVIIGSILMKYFRMQKEKSIPTDKARKMGIVPE